MKKQVLAVVVLVLVVVLASVAAASTIDYDVLVSGGITTYTYSVTSEETGDLITRFHVYAPVPLELVSGWSVTDGWSFATGIDAETGDADVCWYADGQQTSGLADGETLTVVLTTNSSIPTLQGYSLPDCQGNWGYETQFWDGYGVWVLGPPVPVPQLVPEPASLTALLTGIIGILGYRGLRRRR